MTAVFSVPLQWHGGGTDTKWESAYNVNSGEDNFPAGPAGIWTRILSIMTPRNYPGSPVLLRLLLVFFFLFLFIRQYTFGDKLALNKPVGTFNTRTTGQTTRLLQSSVLLSSVLSWADRTNYFTTKWSVVRIVADRTNNTTAQCSVLRSYYHRHRRQIIPQCSTLLSVRIIKGRSYLFYYSAVFIWNKMRTRTPV